MTSDDHRRPGKHPGRAEQPTAQSLATDLNELSIRAANDRNLLDNLARSYDALLELVNSLHAQLSAGQRALEDDVRDIDGIVRDWGAGLLAGIDARLERLEQRIEGLAGNVALQLDDALGRPQRSPVATDGPVELDPIRCTYHVGLTKAASTSLQEYLDVHPRAARLESIETMYRLVTRSDLAFSASNAHEHLAALVGDARSADLVPVLSHERLSGSPLSGHYDLVTIANRIKLIDPEARIVLILREQASLVTSVYKQYVRIGGTRSLREFLWYWWDAHVPRFDFAAYEYDKLVQFYFDTFGRENVRILFFEDLGRDGARFRSDFDEFVGLEPDDSVTIPHSYPSIRDELTESTRVDSMFRDMSTTQPSFREPDGLPDAMRDEAIRWHRQRTAEEDEAERAMSIVARTAALIDARYAGSNSRLAELLGEDLASRGYRVS